MNEFLHVFICPEWSPTPEGTANHVEYANELYQNEESHMFP